MLFVLGPPAILNAALAANVTMSKLITSGPAYH